MSRITIKEVAKEAGVSPSAVSRVYKDGGSVSDAVRAKVLAAAEKLGYRPNALARAMTQTNINLVAVISGTWRTVLEVQVIDRLTRNLADHGLQTMLVPISDGGSLDEALMTALDYRVCASVVAHGTLGHEALAHYADQQVPLIISGGHVDAPGVDSIYADNSGTEEATRFLYRTGCQSILYIGTIHQPRSDLERFEGYRRAVEAQGDKIRHYKVETDDPDAMDQMIAALTDQGGCDGVILANDSLAALAMDAAHRLHLNVPEDLSLIGFDDAHFLGRTNDRLTSIHYPVEQVADWMAERILARRDTLDLPNSVKMVPTHLRIRQSTRSFSEKL